MAGSLILSDNRRQLVNSVQLYQPSFLYAYVAIFMQGGVIQVSHICGLGLLVNNGTFHVFFSMKQNMLTDYGVFHVFSMFG